jgi:uncharacterized repeat protein (TIGR01451 family)
VAAAGCVMCIAAPTRALAAAPAIHLVLTQTVDRTAAMLGDRLSYTVTLGNVGSLAATLVTVDDVLSGDAGFAVDDGRAGMANSFAGSPVTTITRVLTGHYRWGYAVVNPGDIDVVRFDAAIVRGSGDLPAGSVVTLDSTASTPGAASAEVRTTAVLTAAGQGGVAGLPATGSGLDLSPAVFLFLGGMGIMLLLVVERRREGRAADAGGRSPGRSR